MVRAVNDTERQPIRHGKLSRPSAIRFALSWVASALAVVLVSALTVAGLAVWQIGSSFKPGIELAAADGKALPEIGAIEGGVNFLLVGNDSGNGNPAYGKREGPGRNDVTVLVHLASDHSHASILTFPRDMYVAIPECPRPDGGHYPAARSQKINAAYGNGGVSCVAETVTNLTGLPISYAADIEFDGAVAMADAIGGVEVCLSGPIRDRYTTPPLDLPAGIVPLTGATAVSFLRSRHGVGDGSDLGRVSNQQLFFAALVRQTREQLSDLPTVYRLATAAAEHMRMSTNLQSVTTLASIALAFKKVDFQNIVFVQYPTHYPGAGEPDVNGVLPSKRDADEVVDAILADLPVTLTGKTSGAGATTLNPGAETPLPTPSGAPDSPPTGVTLSDTIFGQTAAQQTCTVAYGRG